VGETLDGLKQIEAVYFRCTSRKREPLSTGGALRSCGRYNVTGCAALYLASSPTLAVSEHLHLGEIFEAKRFPPRLLVSVEVTLTLVLDLTDESTRGRFGLTLEDLTGPYSEDPNSPSITQTSLSRRARAGSKRCWCPPRSCRPRRTSSSSETTWLPLAQSSSSDSMTTFPPTRPLPGSKSPWGRPRTSSL